LPGDLDSCKGHGSLSPRRGKVKVLLVCEVERFLEGEPRWLLGIRHRNPQEQGEKHFW
jgi:hypothetical protein